jgi:hypothetical protein
MIDKREGKINSEMINEIDANELLAIIAKGTDLIRDNIHIKGFFSSNDINLDRNENGKYIIKAQIKITNSEIQGVVSFGNVVFEKPIEFSGTTFKKEVWFRNSEFRDEAIFFDSKFQDDAIFEYAVFEKKSSFNWTEFQKIAVFINTKFGRSAPDKIKIFSIYSLKNEERMPTEFVCTSFEDTGNFTGAVFYNDVDFMSAKSRNDVLFWNSIFVKRINLNRLYFAKIYIKWDQIKDHLVPYDSSYPLLIKNFAELGQLEDRDNCYYQYRHNNQKSKKWCNIQFGDDQESEPFLVNWSKIADVISWLTCGYGVRPHYTIMITLFSIFGFAFVYKIFNGLYELENNEDLTLKLWSEPSTLDCLYFSIMTYTSQASDYLYPLKLLYPVFFDWKYVIMFERIFGYLFLALFVVVLTRKLIR